MAAYFRSNIAALDGYTPGEQPRDPAVIKLNTNENPYPPSPKVRAALRRAADASLRLYPEPLSQTLRAVAAQVYGVQPENIIAGNGSDEILSILLRSFVGPKDRVAFPVPTYSLYETLVEIQDGRCAPVAFPADFSVPEGLAAQDAALTFLCNPNAPSGTLVPLTEIVNLARTVKGILVVDEAYVDFASTEGASSIPLIRQLPNLIVLRTFSKSFSLAGMRIGLAFAAEELIAGMMKVKDSYNLNRLSMVAACSALQDLAWMQRNAERIKRSRQQLTNALLKLGYEVYPSHTNFVLARKVGRNQRIVYEGLKQQNILVRYFDVPGLQDCLRITVGTAKEIRSLLKELKEIVAAM
ncbi:MAG: histidinol-phosphate transaminase [Deltaproteobacteria bacterium]|nr:histidinol-phosphate transaminase [Deltaproteobacteria bacterium]MBM4296264.1 histidinol-phosphate transaminase [Deltaproteobacteria bacterium]